MLMTAPVSRSLPEVSRLENSQNEFHVTNWQTPGLNNFRLNEFGAFEGPPCDLNADGVIDNSDINAIFVARNTPAVPGDARDADGDGVITVLDARQCVLACNNPRCAPTGP